MGLKVKITLFYGAKIDLTKLISLVLSEEDSYFEELHEKLYDLQCKLQTKLNVPDLEIVLENNDDLTNGFIGFPIQTIFDGKSGYNETSIYIFKPKLGADSKETSDLDSHLDQTHYDKMERICTNVETSECPKLVILSFIE